MFDGFTLEYVDLGELRLRVRYGGNGSPVLLLHGHPRTHTTWHRVAPLLKERFTVVCPDLRGYGESKAPPDLPDHAQASKRAMAEDAVELMSHLGHPRFAIVGHDRGGYVAVRAALDHPAVISHLIFLGGVPIGEALARADANFASRWAHWFFFGLPDRPERAISCDPDAWYGGDPAAMGRENYEDYRRAIRDPVTVHTMVEDYRAGLGVDRAADAEDRSSRKMVEAPTLVLWGKSDDIEAIWSDPLEIWRDWSPDVRGHGLPAGHHLPEEVPELLAEEIAAFITQHGDAGNTDPSSPSHRDG
jgi:haloacetate dehalogenase